MKRKYVYVMRGSQFKFKIGISNNPERRLKEVSHRPKLVVKHSFYFAERIEKALHKMYRRSRTTRSGSGRTEWFVLSIFQLLSLRILLWGLKLLQESIIIGAGIGVVVLLIWLWREWL